MNTPNAAKFKEECKELLKIYKFKGYRRHGQFLKTLHYNDWKIECSLSEFVWNFCRTPQLSNRLVTHLQKVIIDDTIVTKWLLKANLNIDPKVTFMSIEDSNKHLEENADTTHVHFLHQGMEQAVDQPETAITSIDYTQGDIFHGILMAQETLTDDIDNIQFIFESEEGEYHYIYYEDDINEIKYTIHDSNESTEDSYIVVPLFKHPIPLVYLEDNNVKLYVRIILKDTFLAGGTNPSSVEVFPIYSILNEQYCQWFEDRNLRLSLRDGDKLSIGATKIKIIE
jgi:hypothetical protein